MAVIMRISCNQISHPPCIRHDFFVLTPLSLYGHYHRGTIYFWSFPGVTTSDPVGDILNCFFDCEYSIFTYPRQPLRNDWDVGLMCFPPCFYENMITIMPSLQGHLPDLTISNPSKIFSTVTTVQVTSINIFRFVH